MATLAYRIVIDWSELDAATPGDDADISEHVLAAEWRIGFTEVEQAIAPPGEARVRVRDPDGMFMPERSAALGRPTVLGKPLLIQVTAGISGVSTSVTLFAGSVERVEIEDGAADWAHSQPRVVLIARTLDAQLAHLPADLPMMTNARADEAVFQLLRRAILRPLRRRGRWVLGIPPYSTLNAPPLSATLPIPAALEAGISRFARVGSAWEQTAAALIRLLAENEGGRFYAARDSTLTFVNRHRPLRQPTPTYTFADNAPLELGDGGEVNALPAPAERVNHVRARLTPRAVGAASTVLWTLPQSVGLLPGETAITARFMDVATGENVQAIAVSGLTFAANSRADGTGQPLTLDGRITRVGAESAELRFTHFNAGEIYLLAGAELRGTPLITGAPLLVEARDGERAAWDGARLLDLDLPLVSRAVEAGDRARFELLSRRAPRAIVRTAQFRAAQHPAALVLTVFSRIRARTGVALVPPYHEADYWVMGEQHALDATTRDHRVRLLLMPTPTTVFWELNARALGQAALAH